MRNVTIVMVGGSFASWAPTTDIVLHTAACSAGASLLISQSPTALESDLKTPTVVDVRHDVIAYLGQGASPAQTIPQDLNFPVQAGEPIYLSSSTGTAVQLFYDVVEPS